MVSTYGRNIVEIIISCYWPYRSLGEFYGNENENKSKGADILQRRYVMSHTNLMLQAFH